MEYDAINNHDYQINLVTTSMIARLKKIYWKFGPVLLLFICLLLIATLWTLYVLGRISIKYALITSISGIIFLYVISATRKSVNAVANYEANKEKIEPAFTLSIGTARNIQRYLDVFFFSGIIILLLILHCIFLCRIFLANVQEPQALETSHELKARGHVLRSLYEEYLEASPAKNAGRYYCISARCRRQ